MPGRDGTGPTGKGPMTGRKLGPCNKESTAQPINFGRNCGRGMGRGFGCRPIQTEEKSKE